MLVIGLLLFGTAVASAIILSVQNHGSVVQVHALGAHLDRSPVLAAGGLG